MTIILSLLLLAMSDASALIRAQTIWGKSAIVFKLQSASNPGAWEYKVGCRIPAMVVAGSGISWDRAFAAVNPQRNGPHILAAPWVDGKIQWTIDGIPFATGSTATWDSTKGGTPTGEGRLVYSCNP